MDWQPIQLDIDVSARCNLNCAYCYLGAKGQGPEDRGQGPGGEPAQRTRGTMFTDVADQVLEYTRRLAARHGGRIAWHLFGGEPFLGFETVQYLVLEAEWRKLPVDVGIFTNGATATRAQVEWCQKHRVTPHRSAGGCPAACQATRPGDYLERYEREALWWNDRHLPRRVTVTPATAGTVMDSLRYVYGQGYWGGVDFDADAYADWTDEAIETYLGQLTRLAAEFVRQFRAGHVLWCEGLQKTASRLFGPPTLYLGCAAGWGLQAITFDGYVMPCHRFLREPRDSAFCGGRLADLLTRGAPGVAGSPAFGAEFTEHVAGLSRGEEEPECLECPARPSCSHGCYHLAKAASGTLKRSPKVWCAVQRHYVELARQVNEQLAGLDARWYDCQAEPCDPIPEEA